MSIVYVALYKANQTILEFGDRFQFAEKSFEFLKKVGRLDVENSRRLGGCEFISVVDVELSYLCVISSVGSAAVGFSFLKELQQIIITEGFSITTKPGISRLKEEFPQKISTCAHEFNDQIQKQDVLYRKTNYFSYQHEDTADELHERASLLAAVFKDSFCERISFSTKKKSRKRKRNCFFCCCCCN